MNGRWMRRLLAMAVIGALAATAQEEAQGGRRPTRPRPAAYRASLARYLKPSFLRILETWFLAVPSLT